MCRGFTGGVGDQTLLLSVGTSSLVHPAAQVPWIAKRAGARVIQVNPNPTALDEIADLNLRLPAAAALPTLVASLSADRWE